MKNKFDHLIIIGRPACGKSEFIDFMKKADPKDRLNKYHIGQFEEVDDFVWLWEKCVEDDLWENLGEERLVSKRSGHAYFITNPRFYDFLIEKFSPEIEKKYVSNQKFYDEKTLLVEFSRGLENAYKSALWRFSKPVLEKAAIIYIKVSFEESYRRNDARYKEKLKHSILAHKVPDEEMYKYYKIDDWSKVTDGKPSGMLDINGTKVPFVTMDNEPELKDSKLLDERYHNALEKLFELYSKR